MNPVLFVALLTFVAIFSAWFYFTLLRAYDRERRQHARERDLLLNQIMHLSGKTWTPPPAHEEREAPEPRVTVRSPEQYPDEELA